MFLLTGEQIGTCSKTWTRIRNAIAPDIDRLICHYLPLFDEVLEQTEKVGRVDILWTLAEHEANFAVGILHLGKRLPHELDLLVSLIVEAVHWGQGAYTMQ